VEIDKGRRKKGTCKNEKEIIVDMMLNKTWYKAVPKVVVDELINSHTQTSDELINYIKFLKCNDDLYIIESKVIDIVKKAN